MSVKASISSSNAHHLYFEELLSEDPRFVFLELTDPEEFSVHKEKFKERSFESITVQIPQGVMDDIAIAWIKRRKLQGALGGPVGLEWGSPDCPYD
ncbi:hypothetical protein [Marinobacter sp.]|uniref:hypothetical protein n=1 Tax=Marinobacter sp. TaxID=50741 RepID=UPI0035C72B37